jgi:tetratricopeptide (TPR) repeat protein
MVEFEAEDATMRARLARAYLAAGKVLDSEASIKQAFRLEKSSPEAFVAQAELDMHQGYPASAKKNYLKALAAGLEKTYDVNLALAQFYLGENKKEEAIEYLKKAIADFPRDVSPASPYRRLYLLYKESDKEEKAFEQLAKIIELSDRELQARGLLADRFIEEEKFKEAVRILRQMTDLNPIMPGLHERLGDALRGEDEIDKAIEEYKMAIVVGGRGKARAYAGLAQCYLDKDDADQAESNARKALELDPGNELAREILELLDKWSE